MDRLKSILFYLIFVCPFNLLAVDSNLYNELNDTNYRQNLGFQKNIDFKNINFDLLNAAVFFRTNEIRVKHGKNPLNFHPALLNAAQMHASDMVAHNFISHTNHFSKDRKEPTDRYVLCNIENPLPAENIANSFAIRYKANTPVYVIDSSLFLFSYEPEGNTIEHHSYLSFADALVELWMISDGHRSNILRDTAVELGCACVFYVDKVGSMPKFMCVQNFQLYRPVVLKNYNQ